MSSFLKISLPNEWKIKKMKDCLFINPENLIIKGYNDNFINYIDIASIDTTTHKIKETKQIPISEIPSRARRLVKENDVIISTVRPYLKAFSKITKDYDNFICSTGFAVLRANEGINHEYLFQYTLSKKFLHYMCSRMVGSSYPAVNVSDVVSAPIVVPPLNEQRQIALILSKLDSLNFQTHKIIEKLIIIKKGVMRQILTKGIGNKEFNKKKNPISWKILNFQNAIIKPKKKIYSLKKKEYQNIGNYPIIDQSQEFIAGYSDRADLVYDHNQPVIIFGDHTRIFKYIDFKFICGADGTKVIVPNYKIFDPLYLYYFLFNLRIRELGYSRHFKLLKEMDIFKPPIEEQKQISKILRNIDKKIQNELAFQEKLRLIKNFLMEELFSGRKRLI